MIYPTGFRKCIISISITPVGTTEKMWDGSISIWGDGYYETNGDAKPE